MTAIEAPAQADPVLFPHRDGWGDFCRLARAIWRLNRAGLSHGDLTPANAGLNARGEMALLDLDQAVGAHPVRCFLRDAFGVPCADQPAQYTLSDRASRLRGLGWTRWPTTLRHWLRRRRDQPVRSNETLVQRAEVRGDADLVELARCWQEAAVSGANSPNTAVAYYSADVRGFHLPGERPWALRWEMLAAGVAFAGKRVVELGCNLGLLASQARSAGAASAVGADHNHRVIMAARRLANLLGSGATFEVVDFDRDPGWETRLGGDLVTALSLTYWLRDRERLWRHLGRFPEAVFEGHEPPEEVQARLRALGFIRIHELGVSERNRIVFHASKQ